MPEYDTEIPMVEDNPNDEMLALLAFKRSNIVNQIYVVRDGVEALDYVLRRGDYAGRKLENPKVILLDVKLPLIDGIEVLRRIRDNPETISIPVLMLTTSNEDRDVIESYRLGVNSYIVKPMDFEQFKEVARHLGYYWLFLNTQLSAAKSLTPVSAVIVGSV